MRKFLLLITTSIVLLFLLTGCELKKEMIGTTEFKEMLTERNFDYMEASPADLDDTIEASITGEIPGILIEFIVLDTEDTAKETYRLYEKLIDDASMSLSKRTSETAKALNYDYYKLFTEENFFILVRVENTVMFSSGTNDNEDTAKEIFKELGY